LGEKLNINAKIRQIKAKNGENMQKNCKNMAIDDE
jgi:hypothetical protein